MQVLIMKSRYESLARKRKPSDEEYIHEGREFCWDNEWFIKSKVYDYVMKHPDLKIESVIRISVREKHYRMAAMYLEFRCLTEKNLVTILKKITYRKAYSPIEDNDPPSGSSEEMKSTKNK